jgi:glutamate-ammonia-ligase adenylyltransferase
MKLHHLIKNVVHETPDPSRSAQNLTKLFNRAPELLKLERQEIQHIATLFSYSQFLADFCIHNTSNLTKTLELFKHPIDKKTIIVHGRSQIPLIEQQNAQLIKQDALKILREIKRSYLLLITLRDISGITTVQECMSELSILAEAIIELGIEITMILMKETFGSLKDDSYCIIGLGKLGASELNYSSDIDIMSVYRLEDAFSSGVKKLSGVRTNRISSHEYFCRLTEMLASLLHTPTEDGFAYRVDLRLRPYGQKGAIAFPLASYRSYYEAWGRTWERMALVRARPVAGDHRLGKCFMDTIEPFVWKRSTDYNDIEEIKSLKKKIDTLGDVQDIKRGYGGIREIEFFVHTFQLLYGGEREQIRRRSLLNSLDALTREGFLSEADYQLLSESYLFLRRLEHILQMQEDLQTYSLPSQEDELNILARKMRFRNNQEFTAALRLKRLKIRDMYNSLLGKTDETHDILLSLQDELSDESLLDYLSFKGFHDSERALKNLRSLNEYIAFGKTIRQRTLLRKTIPLFLSESLHYTNKDRILKTLVSFIEKVGMHESYLDLLSQREDTRQIMVYTFSSSIYLTRLLLTLENLEGIFEYPDIRIDFEALRERLIQSLKGSTNPRSALREYKMIEELKTGLLFLKGAIDVYAFSDTLSSLADTIIQAIVEHLRADSFAVVALGAYGARELNINSDLDLLFIKEKGVGSSLDKKHIKNAQFAEDLIGFLTDYTEDGVAYKVDMRLRPDGSKGLLLNDIEGYRNYYLKSAHPWEIQVLIKSRPLAGNERLIRSFNSLKEDVLLRRGRELTSEYIQDMRRKIISDVSKESYGYDLKLGPGGIKEIEFLIQYLQLHHCDTIPGIIIQNAVSALDEFTKHDLLDIKTVHLLKNSHRVLRSIETVLRLNEEDVLRDDPEINDILVRILKYGSHEALFEKVRVIKEQVKATAQKIYE